MFKAYLCRLLWLISGFMLVPSVDAADKAPIVHHELVARIEPANHGLTVNDKIHIPAALVGANFTFLLNSNLKVKTSTPGLVLVQVKENVLAANAGIDSGNDDSGQQASVNVYRVAGAVPGKNLTLELAYEGIINKPVQAQGEAYAHGFSESSGLIDERGVFLAGSSYWVAQVGDALITYDLETDLPATWKSVSQGTRIKTGQGAGQRVLDDWLVDTPGEQIYLVAARFTEYSRDIGTAEAYAFLRKPDDALATRYLGATAQYMAMYNRIIGAYPYTKFALVENFWETGYGMPSFTLLGEQVIRFPFILTSSYPHELLHNWWGNGGVC